MHLKSFFIILMLISTLPGFLQAQTKIIRSVSSPNKITRCEVGVNTGGRIVYRVLFNKKEILRWSAMGLLLNDKNIGDNVVFKSQSQNSVNEKFTWRLGENDTITNQYNESISRFSSHAVDLILTVRVYDGSIAFRYEITEPQRSTGNSIKKEYTQFNFRESYTLYQYNGESVFTPVSIDTFSKTCDFPATLTNGKYYISIGEAANISYSKGELKKSDVMHGLTVTCPRDSAIKFDAKFRSPWRTISISTSAIGLHKYSELNLKLNEPSSAMIPDWIKPGKLIRSQLNTQAGIDCIDFAVKNHFQYIMFDAGWYGAEFRSSSDPTQVIPQIDMLKVIQYGKDKGIGVILYVNYIGLKARLDEILPLYKKWGVAGLKFGFVDGLTQDGITWLIAAIKKVNDFGFVLDIHDNYKPTGLSRTYPSLLTQEGIRGDENSPDAFHNTVLPFTRFLAGPADFTFCFPNSKNNFSKNIKVSMAQQLALTVVYFSPLQAIFWYGQPNDYTNEQEIEFFRRVPTTWNESHYLSGDIGKNISVARRKENDWFIGNVAGPEDWQTSIRLSFLTKGKNYRATIYEDDGQSGIRKRNINVKQGDLFPVDLKAKGGQAIILEQVN